MKKPLPWLIVGGLLIFLIKEYWFIILILGIIIIVLFFLLSGNKEGVNKVKRDLYTDAINSFPKKVKHYPSEDRPYIAPQSIEYIFKPNSNLYDHNLAFIDFETANKQRGSAIQLGITTFKKGQVITKQWKFKPYRTNMKNEFMFTYLHGITPDMVIDKPHFHEVWDEIYKEIEGCVIVAHNASFDLRILDYMFERKIKPDSPIRFNYICTLELARKYLSYGTSRFGLEHLCKRFGLPYGNHDGEKDSLSCMYVLNLILDNAPNRLNYDRLLRGKKWVDTPMMITTSITIDKKNT